MHCLRKDEKKELFSLTATFYLSKSCMLFVHAIMGVAVVLMWSRFSLCWLDGLSINSNCRVHGQDHRYSTHLINSSNILHVSTLLTHIQQFHVLAIYYELPYIDVANDTVLECTALIHGSHEVHIRHAVRNVVRKTADCPRLA